MVSSCSPVCQPRELVTETVVRGDASGADDLATPGHPAKQDEEPEEQKESEKQNPSAKVPQPEEETVYTGKVQKRKKEEEVKAAVEQAQMQKEKEEEDKAPSEEVQRRKEEQDKAAAEETQKQTLKKEEQRRLAEERRQSEDRRKEEARKESERKKLEHEEALRKDAEQANSQKWWRECHRCFIRSVKIALRVLGVLVSVSFAMVNVSQLVSPNTTDFWGFCNWAAHVLLGILTCCTGCFLEVQNVMHASDFTKFMLNSLGKSLFYTWLGFNMFSDVGKDSDMISRCTIIAHVTGIVSWNIALMSLMTSCTAGDACEDEDDRRHLDLEQAAAPKTQANTRKALATKKGVPKALAQ